MNRAPSSALPSFIQRAVRAVDHLDATGIYMIDGKVAVDHMIRYENLATEFDAVLATLGLPTPAELPRAKGKARFDRRPATEVLSPEQKDVIYERLRLTFDLFGYEP